MNREDTADSSTFYDSHDEDNEDYDGEVEDDYVDGNPFAESFNSASTKPYGVADASSPEKKPSSTTQKAKGGSKKKKGSRKKRPKVVANLAATKFSIGTEINIFSVLTS